SGAGQEARHRRYIENTAAVATETVNECQRQFRQNANIDIDDGELLGGLELHRRPHQTEAGIVDDILGLDRERGHLRGDFLRRLVAREIDGQHMRPRLACRCDLIGKVVEPLLTPRHQDQPMAVSRKHPRKFRADACRCSCDQRHRPPTWRGLAHVPPLSGMLPTAWPMTCWRSAMRSRGDTASKSATRHITLSSNSLIAPSAKAIFHNITKSRNRPCSSRCA